MEITLRLSEVDCDEQRKMKADKEKDSFMGLRNKAPTTGPGTELANLLKMIGINQRKKVAPVNLTPSVWIGRVRNGAAKISKPFLAGSKLNPKKESCLL